MLKVSSAALVLAAMSFVSESRADDVCAGETGAGWGLCNAFCDAMKCGTPEQNASPNACDKVKANYQAKTGNPSLPCEAPPVCGDPVAYQECLDASGFETDGIPEGVCDSCATMACTVDGETWFCK